MKKHKTTKKLKLYTLTEAHKKTLKPWADKWIKNGLATGPMSLEEKLQVREAVKGLYRAANLIPPPDHRIVFVSSPLILRFAAGFAAGIWYLRTQKNKRKADAATHAATRDATREATREATDAATRIATSMATHAATDAATSMATHAATDAATREATREATDAATRVATSMATDMATREATHAATRMATHDATREATDAATRDLSQWFTFDIKGVITTVAMFGPVKFLLACAQQYWGWDGGNQWSGWVSYLSWFRHKAKLPIDYSKWDMYEKAAIAGPRILHKEFVMISERPDIMLVDEQNRPHCATGPYCQWSDGTGLYMWHGVKVPAIWILDPKKLDPKAVLQVSNLDVRRAGLEIIGWKRVLEILEARVVDTDVDQQIGTLLEVDLPDAPKSKFLQVKCGTGRDFVLSVPDSCKTALEANAWTYGVEETIMRNYEVRT